jgi:tRNA splicing ligase
MVNSSAQKVMTRVDIQWQDQFGRWQHFQTMHNEANAFRTAQSRARSTGKRHRLVDANGQLLDLVEP